LPAGFRLRHRQPQGRARRLGRLDPGDAADEASPASSPTAAVATRPRSRGVVAHAIDEAAAAFYVRHGFVRSPLGERVMLMPIETVRSLVAT